MRTLLLALKHTTIEIAVIKMTCNIHLSDQSEVARLLEGQMMKKFGQAGLKPKKSDKIMYLKTREKEKMNGEEHGY